MIVERPPAELTADAIHVLYRELGVVETVRFLRQFNVGYGNYTQEREALFGTPTLEALLDDIKHQRGTHTSPQ